MASTTPTSGSSHLQNEYMQLKISLYQTFTLFSTYATLVTAILDLCRALLSLKISMTYFPFVTIIISVCLLKVCSNLKQTQVRIITIFNIIWYLASLSAHYYGDSGLFDHPIDIFYLAYAYGLAEKTISHRMPTVYHRAIFGFSTIIVRVLIVAPHDMVLVIAHFVQLGISTYLDWDQETQDKKLFKSYLHNKEQLDKFKALKDLVENYIPEAIIVMSEDLSQEMFLNNAFKGLLYPEDSISNIRAQLRRFRLCKPISSSDSLAPEYDNSPGLGGKTLLDVLTNSNRVESFLTKANSYHLTFTKIVSREDKEPLESNLKEEEKIFDVKVINMIWDEVPAIAVVLHDITQQQTILKIKIAADANKDRMLATVSHELRTPLNGILGMIQVIHKKVKDQDILLYLQICKNSANLLLGLVNSILDLNQIRANKLRLYHEKVYLQELMKELIDLFEFQCQQKNIALRLQMSPRAAKVIITDRNRLSQIFINLLGNAVKFTASGSITIMVQESEYQDMVKFSVQDTGMGIKEEDKEKMFHMYGRLDQENSQVNRHGVGLGLTISNNLAQLLCGNAKIGGIKVKSEYERGSTFTFLIKKSLDENVMTETKFDFQETYPTMTDSFFEELNVEDHKIRSYQMKPFRTNPSPNVSSALLPSSSNKVSLLNLSPKNTKSALLPSSGSQSNRLEKVLPTILIVDDNPFNITVAIHLVSSKGFNVKSALYGQTAIEIALKNDHKTEPLQLILMDCQMPVMDGYETTRKLKELMKNGKIPEIPIIALTANNSLADREACQEAGMCDYLTKPLTEANLAKVLKKHPRK